MDVKTSQHFCLLWFRATPFPLTHQSLPSLSFHDDPISMLRQLWPTAYVRAAKYFTNWCGQVTDQELDWSLVLDARSQNNDHCNVSPADVCTGFVFHQTQQIHRIKTRERKWVDLQLLLPDSCFNLGLSLPKFQAHWNKICLQQSRNMWTKASPKSVSRRCLHCLHIKTLWEVFTYFLVECRKKIWTWEYFLLARKVQLRQSDCFCLPLELVN